MEKSAITTNSELTAFKTNKTLQIQLVHNDNNDHGEEDAQSEPHVACRSEAVG